MNKAIFEIGAPGVDTEKIVREVQEAVARKAEQGVYADARIARAERSNLVNLRNDEEFLVFYLRTLHEAVFVDISDFEIRERRPLLAPLLIAFKKLIWNLLKFYTYRLWSQQNMVNGLFVSGLESLYEKSAGKIKQLEVRVAELERRLGDKKDR